MHSKDTLHDIQQRIARRTLRYRQASRYLAELNSSGVHRSDIFIDRITRNFQRAQERLTLAREDLKIFLGSKGTQIILTQQNSAEGAEKVIVTANTELLQFLAKNPKYMHTLRSRAFEELIAGIFADLGYRVDLMRATHDGGKDLILRTEGPLGPAIAYVQCKRHSPLRPVGIEVVRELYGVQVADKVNKSMIVTTSYFTREAVDFSRGLAFLISLRDYDDIVSWLSRYVSKST